MYPTVDSATGLQVLLKQPAEVVTHRMDFGAPLLAMGTTLASITSAVAQNQGVVGGSSNVTVVSSAIVGNSVNIKLSGGTDLENYKITVKAVDSDGHTVEGDGMLYVRDN